MPRQFDTVKTALSELTRSLRGLHRSLVDAARTDYEKEYGPITDAGQLLQLLTKDPHFDWLHELSEFMVYIDELLDDERASEADMRAVFSQLQALITPSAEGKSSEFSQRYIALLQSDPVVTMAHADVRRLLASL